VAPRGAEQALDRHPAAGVVAPDVLRPQRLDCPGRGGNLAETDTFAQCTEDGAFSFSESLAAFDPADDMIIT